MNDMDARIKEYKDKEDEFFLRTDSLCEDKSPMLCDCSKCPTQELCKWLDENNPYRKDNE